MLNPDVRKQTGERYVALNLQLLLPRMASAGKIYQKGEVEYSLVREQFGESGNRYFAKAQFAMDNPNIKTFTRVPKQDNASVKTDKGFRTSTRDSKVENSFSCCSTIRETMLYFDTHFVATSPISLCTSSPSCTCFSLRSLVFFQLRLNNSTREQHFLTALRTRSKSSALFMARSRLWPDPDYGQNS